MGFRANEETADRVESQTGAKVAHEVVDCHIVSAGVKIADLERLVVASAFGSKAGQQFEIRMLGHSGKIHGIEIPERRPIRLHIKIFSARGTPGKFALDPEIPEKHSVSAEAEIRSAV